MAMTPPESSPQHLTPEDAACLRALAGAHFLGGEVTLPSGRKLSADEMQALTSAYAPEFSAPPPPKDPPADTSWIELERPAKRERRRSLIVLVAGLVALAVVGAVLAIVFGSGSPNKPAAGTSTYKPIYDNKDPVAPATTEPTYPIPTDADFQLTPKVTQKQCFGSAGCNVTFTVDLAYAGKGAKPFSTWDITFDAVGSKDALTDTIKLHFDATGAHGTYNSTEQIVQTEKSSDPLTLRITAISPGVG